MVGILKDKRLGSFDLNQPPPQKCYKYTPSPKKILSRTQLTIPPALLVPTKKFLKETGSLIIGPDNYFQFSLFF